MKTALAFFGCFVLLATWNLSRLTQGQAFQGATASPAPAEAAAPAPQAQSAPAPRAIEYGVLYADPGTGLCGFDDGQREIDGANFAELARKLGSRSNKITGIFNALGANGWYLIQINNSLLGGIPGTEYYFMRYKNR